MDPARPVEWTRIEGREQKISTAIDDLDDRVQFPEILGDVVEQLLGNIGDGCVVSLEDDDEDARHVVALAHVDETKESVLRTAIDDNKQILEAPVGASLIGMGQSFLWHAQSQPTAEPGTSPDGGTESLFFEVSERLDIQSLLVVSLQGLGEQVGVMTLMTTEEDSPVHGEEDRQLIERFAARLALLIQNLRQRRQLQQHHALMQQLATKHAIAKHLGEGAVALDDDGVITFANPAATTLLGWTSADHMLGQNFHQIVHRGRPCLKDNNCALQHGFSSRSDIRSHDDDFAQYQGRSRPVVYTMTPLVTEYEQGVVIAFRDMSKYRSMQAQSVATDRMVAVGTLASGLAHEINNPLAYVRSNLRFVLQALENRRNGIAESDTPSDDELREALVDGMDGVERIQSIVAGMQTFTQLDREVGIIDAEKCLHDALTVCHGELRRHSQVERQGEPLEFVRADSTRLTQVFVNLLLNAAMAIEESGKFGRIVITTSMEDEQQIVEIRDNGVGIELGAQRQIFDPFYTVRKGTGGTGLGLYVCRAIINEIDGDISVSSEPAQGAVFRVALPRRDQEGQRVSKSE